MRTTSEAGGQVVEQIGQRHGFGAEATRHMLEAVRRGNGSMAQFGHAEFAGPGQWMRGGMTMVSDLFNHDLKRRVAGLCEDLAGVVAGEAHQEARRNSTGAASSGVSSGTSSGNRQDTGGGSSSSSTSSDWWPGDLGRPNSAGSQNDMRYAWFADARRLAIKRGGEVAVYDTQDHRISGVSQQQGGTDSVSFSSQHGPVSLDDLPRVDASSSTSTPAHSSTAAAPSPEPQTARTTNTAGTGADLSGRAPAGGDPMALIERLAGLHEKGVLSTEEFNAKKAELLGRL